MGAYSHGEPMEFILIFFKKNVIAILRKAIQLLLELIAQRVIAHMECRTWLAMSSSGQ